MDTPTNPLWALGLLLIACGPPGGGTGGTGGSPTSGGGTTSGGGSGNGGSATGGGSGGTTTGGGGTTTGGGSGGSTTGGGGSGQGGGAGSNPACVTSRSGGFPVFDLGASFGETPFHVETHLPDQSGLGTYNDDTSTSLSNNLLFWCTTWDRLGGLPESSVCFPASTCGGDSGERDALHTPWGDKASAIHSNITLMKWVTAKNAWFARTDCTSGANCPHADSWQGWGGSGRVCPANWYVVQDSVFKNSDSGQQMHLTNWADGEDEAVPTACDLEAFVLQNVEFTQDPDFVTACEARGDEVDAYVTPTANPNATRACNKLHAQLPVRVEPEVDPWTIWLIHVIGPVKAGTSADCVTNRIIRIGTTASQTNGVFVCSQSQYHDYPDIESALAAGETQPPGLELSCTGWQTPPAGCTPTSQRGDQD
jgi:hypothetical protein